MEARHRRNRLPVILTYVQLMNSLAHRRSIIKRNSYKRVVNVLSLYIEIFEKVGFYAGCTTHQGINVIFIVHPEDV